MHTLLYIKQIINKDLLYNTRSFTQYSKPTGEKKGYICMYNWVTLHLKWIQHCISTIPPNKTKIKFKKDNILAWFCKRSCDPLQWLSNLELCQLLITQHLMDSHLSQKSLYKINEYIKNFKKKKASLQTKLVEVMEFQLSYLRSWNMMQWKCCAQYAS